MQSLPPLIAGLFVFSALSGWSQNIRLFSDAKATQVPRVALTEYKSVQLRDNQYQNPELALGIAIAGGGSRAQYFGTGVLLGLEEIKVPGAPNHNFLREVDYFSTVSGGCYAAGYYLTIQKNKLLNKQLFNDFYFSKGDNYKDFVGKSASPLLVLNNNRNERGSRYPMAQRLDFEVLQYDVNNAQNPEKFATQMKLANFFVASTDNTLPTLPMFVPNGTIFNNGERIPFMPHVIAGLKITNSLAPNFEVLSKDARGTNNGYDFPLTYAITASSAFPGVLPKTKFQIKDTVKVLCVIDGGVVDNLGYTTLIELLNSDATSNKSNKKALIVDCSGEGGGEQLGEDKKIGLVKLMETSLLYTVESKYLYYGENMQNQMCSYGIPTNNSLIIGFSTIREQVQNLRKAASPIELAEYYALQTRLTSTKDKDKDKKWFPFYTAFRDSLISRFSPQFFKQDAQGNTILSSLATEKFGKLRLADVFLLYEYAAQVETKLKIFADEREMLLLAGRYTVYLKRKEIESLLATK